MTIVFTCVAVAVVVVILRMARRLTSAWWAVALGLVLGGALGNLVDRLLRSPGPGRGHVVDFLELPRWPVFNLADSAIVVAGVLMVVLSARGVPHDEPAGDRGRTAPNHATGRLTRKFFEDSSEPNGPLETLTDVGLDRRGALSDPYRSVRYVASCDGSRTVRYPARARPGPPVAAPTAGHLAVDRQREGDRMTSVAPEDALLRACRSATARRRPRPAAGSPAERPPSGGRRLPRRPRGRLRHPVAAPARPSPDAAGRGPRHHRHRHRPGLGLRAPLQGDLDHQRGRERPPDVVPRPRPGTGPRLGPVPPDHPDVRRPDPGRGRRRVPPRRPGQHVLLGAGGGRLLHEPLPVLPTGLRAVLRDRDRAAAARPLGRPQGAAPGASALQPVVAPGPRRRRAGGGRGPRRGARARALCRAQGRRRLHASR